MAEDRGLTIPTGSYPTLVRNMQRLSHLPINGMQTRTRKGPKFPPGPGSRIYQCVHGPRLKKGTPRYPEDTSRLEPVCICVVIGSATDTGIEQLSNRALFKINDAIKKAGVFDDQGILNEPVWDEFRTKDVSDFDESTGNATTFTLLRVRFCSGSVFPGVILSGNEQDGWASSGSQVLTVEIDDKATVEEEEEFNLYTARIVVNQAAVDNEKAEESQLIEELICVRTERTPGMDLCEGIKVQVSLNPQVWMSNDSAYSDFWCEEEDEGWLPVYECVTRDGYAFRNDSGETIPAYGCFLVNSYATVGHCQVLSADVPDTTGAQYSHYINGPEDVEADEVGLCFREGLIPVLYDPQDGTPAFGELWGPKENLQQSPFGLRKDAGGFRVRSVIDTEAHVMLVSPEPWLEVRGKVSGDVAAGSTGTLTIWKGDVGSEVTTSVTISGVHNLSSCTVKGTPQFATAQVIPGTAGQWQFLVWKSS